MVRFKSQLMLVRPGFHWAITIIEKLRKSHKDHENNKDHINENNLIRKIVQIITEAEGQKF